MAIKPDNLRHAPLLTKAELMRERAQKRKEELAAKKAAKAKAEGKPATDAGPRKAEGETPGDAGPRKANLEDLLDDAAKTKQDKKARQKTDAPKVAGFRKQEEHGVSCPVHPPACLGCTRLLSIAGVGVSLVLVVEVVEIMARKHLDASSIV